MNNKRFLRPKQKRETSRSRQASAPTHRSSTLPSIPNINTNNNNNRNSHSNSIVNRRRSSALLSPLSSPMRYGSSSNEPYHANRPQVETRKSVYQLQKESEIAELSRLDRKIRNFHTVERYKREHEEAGRALIRDTPPVERAAPPIRQALTHSPNKGDFARQQKEKEAVHVIVHFLKMTVQRNKYIEWRQQHRERGHPPRPDDNNNNGVYSLCDAKIASLVIANWYRKMKSKNRTTTRVTNTRPVRTEESVRCLQRLGRAFQTRKKLGHDKQNRRTEKKKYVIKPSPETDSVQRHLNILIIQRFLYAKIAIQRVNTIKKEILLEEIYIRECVKRELELDKLHEQQQKEKEKKDRQFYERYVTQQIIVLQSAFRRFIGKAVVASLKQKYHVYNEARIDEEATMVQKWKTAFQKQVKIIALEESTARNKLEEEEEVLFGCFVWALHRTRNYNVSNTIPSFIISVLDP